MTLCPEQFSDLMVKGTWLNHERAHKGSAYVALATKEGSRAQLLFRADSPEISLNSEALQ